MNPSVAHSPVAGVYHADPQHLWNRLHETLFVRYDDAGREYGRDRIEPLLWRRSKHLLHGEPHRRLLSILDELLRVDVPRMADPLRRAMLQRDVWLVFSWLEHGREEFQGFGGDRADWQAARERLRVPLARAIGRLALTPTEMAELPDTYAAAVASGEVAATFDPAHPDRPYLPVDLFVPDGAWVSLGRGNDLIAPSHLLADNPFTNSAFLVFINLPGGRTATLDYLRRLTRFQGPLFVRGPRTEAAEFPYFNPAIPQFPSGTQLALVRRGLLVTAAGALAVSPITESVEVRAYREVPVLSGPDAFDRATLADEHTRAWQAVAEFALSRQRLFDGRSGGLRGSAVDGFRTGPFTHGVDWFDLREAGRVARLNEVPSRGDSARMCIGCHTLPGVYSFNTFTQQFNAVRTGLRGQLVPMSVADVLASGLRWKEGRSDWLLLQRLLTDASADS